MLLDEPRQLRQLSEGARRPEVRDGDGAHQRRAVREVLCRLKRRKRARAVTMAKQFDERLGRIQERELARRPRRQNYHAAEPDRPDAGGSPGANAALVRQGMDSWKGSGLESQGSCGVGP